MQAKELFGLNICLGNAALGGMTGAAVTFTATNAVAYSVRGKAYSKAAITATAVPTTDGNTGKAFVPQTANTRAVYVFALNAAGAVAVFQSTVEAMTEQGATIRKPNFATIPNTHTAIGYLEVTAGSTAGTWTFGVSNWNATGITTAVTSVVSLPDRP